MEQRILMNLLAPDAESSDKQENHNSKSPSRLTRKAHAPLKVYCLPEERASIQANAKSAGLSTSAFLLAVGQGYQVPGITDYERVRELARINGDLGRLGGLLKLWLTDDVRTAQFGEHTVRRLLARIEATQDQMAGVMKSIVRPRSSGTMDR